jgi:SOS response regulatory protein OraA/RecX
MFHCNVRLCLDIAAAGAREITDDTLSELQSLSDKTFEQFMGLLENEKEYQLAYCAEIYADDQALLDAVVEKYEGPTGKLTEIKEFEVRTAEIYATEIDAQGRITPVGIAQLQPIGDEMQDLSDDTMRQAVIDAERAAEIKAELSVAAPTETPVAVPTEAPASVTKSSVSQQNAIKKAQSYLSHTAFSRQGLIEQLEYEGFPTADAEYGADNSGADWSKQAIKKALSYLGHSAFSQQGLIEQLEYEGFTSEQAGYGVDNCGADWMAQAVKKAESYLSHTAFSRQGLIEQLEYEGFTSEQAAHGVDAVGL